MKVFFVIFALDVIEHIENDIEALHELYKLLKKNGFCFLSIPSFDFLWSEHNEILWHKRKHSLKELEKKVTNSNF